MEWLVCLTDRALFTIKDNIIFCTLLFSLKYICFLCMNIGCMCYLVCILCVYLRCMRESLIYTSTSEYVKINNEEYFFFQNMFELLRDINFFLFYLKYIIVIYFFFYIELCIHFTCTTLRDQWALLFPVGWHWKLYVSIECLLIKLIIMTT